ncbi:hypothetical protein V4S28_11740 [Enterococcus cecorum]
MLGQIDQATSKEAIAEIVKQAQDDNAARLAEEEASQAELAQAKATAKVTVTGLASLPETSKAEYAWTDWPSNEQRSYCRNRKTSTRGKCETLSRRRSISSRVS